MWKNDKCYLPTKLDSLTVATIRSTFINSLRSPAERKGLPCKRKWLRHFSYAIANSFNPNLTPYPRRGGRTFPDPESRPRNSLKSPHNSREWLPGRRGVAAVRLRRRPGYGSRPELFWPWPAKGAASAPLKPPQASASRHGVWLNQPPPLLERPSR